MTPVLIMYHTVSSVLSHQMYAETQHHTYCLLLWRLITIIVYRILVTIAHVDPEISQFDLKEKKKKDVHTKEKISLLQDFFWIPMDCALLTVLCKISFTNWCIFLDMAWVIWKGMKDIQFLWGVNMVSNIFFLFGYQLCFKL